MEVSRWPPPSSQPPSSTSQPSPLWLGRPHRQASPNSSGMGMKDWGGTKASLSEVETFKGCRVMGGGGGLAGLPFGGLFQLSAGPAGALCLPRTQAGLRSCRAQLETLSCRDPGSQPRSAGT